MSVAAGLIFGRWTVIGPQRGKVVPCRCSCGMLKDVRADSLTSGKSESCGCLKVEGFVAMTKATFTTHGLTGTPEYRAWEGMITRCGNPKVKSFKDYGERGITMCDRWRWGTARKGGFECFIEDMGRKPTPEHSIERIHNDLGYSKKNCKWGTRVEQNNNQRPKRKGIPDRVKAAVLERQHHICISCKEPFSTEAPAQFDHRPALILRKVDYELKVYVPDQLDPEFIEALHAPCHLSRTTGRRPGASKTSTTLGSDIGLKTKFARLEKPRKPRTTIQPRGFPKTSRPFPKRRKFDAR